MILHWTENTVSGVFAGLLVILNVPIALLVSSSSGHAALVMAILAPLADFALAIGSVFVALGAMVTRFPSAPPKESET